MFASHWVMMDTVLTIWVIVSMWLGWKVPATLLFLPRRKVKGGTRVVGGVITALLWPFMLIALIVSLVVELYYSVKKGKMRW